MSASIETFHNPQNAPVPAGYSFIPGVDAPTNEAEILAGRRADVLRALASVSRGLQVLLAAARNVERPLPAHWVCMAGPEECPGTLLSEGPENLRCNRCQRLAKPRDPLMRKFLPSGRLTPDAEKEILRTKKACEELEADLHEIERQIDVARNKFQRRQHGWT